MLDKFLFIVFLRIKPMVSWHWTWLWTTSVIDYSFMNLVIWDGFKTRFCNSESTQRNQGSFPQIQDSFKFIQVQVQMINVPLQRGSKRPNCIILHIWTTIDFWSTVEFLVKQLTKVNYLFQNPNLYDFFFHKLSHLGLQVFTILSVFQKHVDMT